MFGDNRFKGQGGGLLGSMPGWFNGGKPLPGWFWGGKRPSWMGGGEQAPQAQDDELSEIQVPPKRHEPEGLLGRLRPGDGSMSPHVAAVIPDHIRAYMPKRRAQGGHGGGDGLNISSEMATNQSDLPFSGAYPLLLPLSAYPRLGASVISHVASHLRGAPPSR